MTQVIKIEGGKKLKGKVRIGGAKNATVALIPAVVLASEPVTILGTPDISDVQVLTNLLEELNANVSKINDTLIIDPANLTNIDLVSENVTKLRASYYFMGALLGRYHYVKVQMPGGCYLGPRPIDLHLKGFEALGATVKYEKGCYIIEAQQLIGNKVYLDIASVGATINIILAAVLATGKTIIENAAKEPEIIDVANLLNKMGAQVRGAGTDTITIEGVDRLGGCVHEIIPDRIEAGTYLIMAAAVGEDVLIENIIPLHLDALISKLDGMGVPLEVGQDFIRVRQANFHALQPTTIKTQTYPGFATDLQQPLTALLTQSNGISKVRETIYGERFKHCEQLNRMGAQIDFEQGACTIIGPSKLQGTRVEATDLRCGAALLIAGLLAEGVTTIESIYHIDRGYDQIDEKLIALGARIWREEEN